MASPADFARHLAADALDHLQNRANDFEGVEGHRPGWSELLDWCLTNDALLPLHAPGLLVLDELLQREGAVLIIRDAEQILIDAADA